MIGNFIMIKKDKQQAPKESFYTRYELSSSNTKYTTDPREKRAFFFSVANQDQRFLMAFGSDSEADRENSEL